MRRQTFCQWYSNKLNENPYFYKKVLWTDETYFSNSGMFNRRNTHYWARENPHLVVERYNQNRFGFNVWCGILDNRLIGPIIYNGNLNAERYLQLLSGEVEEKLEEIPLVHLQNLWYQQDGAPAHNSRNVINYLNLVHDNKVIATNTDVQWPPRSPDLTPCDFFLWGFIKNKVYGVQNFVNVGDLRVCVLQAFNDIDRRTLGRVTRSVLGRCIKCIQNDGALFEE